jgi:hypothetical protein
MMMYVDENSVVEYVVAFSGVFGACEHFRVASVMQF